MTNNTTLKVGDVVKFKSGFQVDSEISVLKVFPDDVVEIYYRPFGGDFMKVQVYSATLEKVED